MQIIYKYKDSESVRRGRHRISICVPLLGCYSLQVFVACFLQLSALILYLPSHPLPCPQLPVLALKPFFKAWSSPEGQSNTFK